ncbi:hypothetical protein [Enterococcus sp. DIV1420a]
MSELIEDTPKEVDVRQEAANYVCKLMISDDKSPEMVAAIAELLEVVFRY